MVSDVVGAEGEHPNNLSEKLLPHSLGNEPVTVSSTTQWPESMEFECPPMLQMAQWDGVDTPYSGPPFSAVDSFPDTAQAMTGSDVQLTQMMRNDL